MRDDRLLRDLIDAVKPPSETYEWLAENGITSYSQLFAFIKDENADAELRAKGCTALWYLRKIVDKRKAVPPLLAALRSERDDVRRSAADALGMMKSRRAVIPLMDFVRDDTLPVEVRHWAIDALTLMEDARYGSLFWKIIFDPSENLIIRSRALERNHEKTERFDLYIALLSDPIPDIRFWAAYRLSYDPDLSALAELDRIVAYDHTLPIDWGWHVDREAICPLETIYARKILGFYDKEDGEYPWYGCGQTYLVSPAPEYDTLSHEYRQRHENFSFITNPLPEITLKVDAKWLADQIRTKWPDIRLNVREPRPQAYLLDWHLQSREKNLIGGLHRDQYAVVLTGDDELVFPFATWYRSIISEEQPLLFYEWADYGVDMPSRMSAAELEQAIDTRDEQRRNWTPSNS